MSENSDVSKNSILVAIGVVVTVGVTGTVFAHDNSVQIIGFCSFICVSLLALLQQIKTDAKMDVAAVKAEEVKTALEDANLKSDKQMAKQTAIITETKETAEKVHILVNSSMSAQLKISMMALQRIAAMTKHPEDIVAAETAENLFREHEVKQGKVDAEMPPSSPLVLPKVAPDEPLRVTVVPADNPLPVEVTEKPKPKE